VGGDDSDYVASPANGACNASAKFVIAVIDTNNVTAESNESNNVVASIRLP
jgi:hypothetical protein